MSLKFRNGSKQTSVIGRLIEVATDGTSQASENWEQFMTICDAINSTEDGPKDAVKAIRKRLCSKQPPSIMLTLKLLETCVKNCGGRFHVCVATKDFMQELVKIISPKYNPSTEMQNTVLGLIQTWALVFQSNAELKEVGKMYQELKAKGIEFPDPDPDQATPIFIPSKSAPPVGVTEIPQPRAGKSLSNPMSPTGQQVVHRHSHSPPVGGMPPVTHVDRLSKLRSELRAVQQNCSVLGELLTETANGDVGSSDLELLEDLNTTCRQMQARIVELIGSVQNEQITDELLSVNDELNNAFVRYDRYQRLRVGRESAMRSEPAPPVPSYEQHYSPPVPSYEQHYSPPVPSYEQHYSPSHAPVLQNPPQVSRNLEPTAAAVILPRPALVDQRVSGGVAVATLIDFGDSSSTTSPASTGIHASSLNNGTQQQVSSSHHSSDHAKETGTLADSETDIAEMERWLMTNPRIGEEQPASSSDFDQFLMERVRDNERLPAVSEDRQQSQHGNELFSL